MSALTLTPLQKTAAVLNYNKNKGITKEELDTIIALVLTASDEIAMEKRNECQITLQKYLSANVTTVKEIKNIGESYDFSEYATILADILILYDLNVLKKETYDLYTDKGSLYSYVFHDKLNKKIEEIDASYDIFCNLGTDGTSNEANDVIDRFYSLINIDFSTLNPLCDMLCENNVKLCEKCKTEKIVVPQKFIDYLTENKEKYQLLLDLCVATEETDILNTPEYVIYCLFNSITQQILPVTFNKLEEKEELLFIVQNILTQHTDIAKVSVPLSKSTYHRVAMFQRLFTKIEYVNGVSANNLYLSVDVPNAIIYFEWLLLR